MVPVKREDWKTLPMPGKCRVIDVDCAYTPDEMQQIVLGFLPRQMEDKWFIFFEDKTLYCHRSWTGFCIYTAEFDFDGKRYYIKRLTVNRNPDEYKSTSDEYDVQVFNSLIGLLLLKDYGSMPGGDPISLWSTFGRASIGIVDPEDEE